MKRSLVCGALVIACSGSFVGSASANQLFFFSGHPDTKWTSPGNWFIPTGGGSFTAANAVPQSGDDVEVATNCDATGVAGGGGAGLVLNSLTVESLAVLTGGSFDIVSSLTFNSEPKAGSAGNGLTNSTVSVRATASVSFLIANTQLTNCTLTIAGGVPVNQNVSITVSNGDIFNQGAWVIQADKALNFAGQNARFDNVGELRGNGGTTTQIVGGSFLTINNSGTVSSYADGTLSINGNINWEAQDGSGSLYAATANAVIILNGLFNVPANTTTYLKGPGTVQANSTMLIHGTLEVGLPASGPSIQRGRAENSPDEIGKLLLKASGMVSGDGTVDIEDDSEVEVLDLVSSSNWTGFYKLRSGARLDVLGPNGNGQDSVEMDGGEIDNEGTITINVRELLMSGVVLKNAIGGLLNINVGSSLLTSGPTPSVLNNSGTINAVAGMGQNPLVGLGLVFNHSAGGTLNVTGSGAFNFYGGGTLAGTFNAPAGVPLSFTGGVFIAQSGIAFGSSDVVVSQGAHFNWTSAFDPIANLEIEDAATLEGSGTLTVTNKFSWNNATLNGLNFVLGSSAVGTISGTNTFTGGVFINNGTCNWTAGQINASNGATWNNLSGAIFDAQSDSTWSGDGSAIFTNQFGALFQKSAGTGATTMGLQFNNNGIVKSISGTLAFCNLSQPGGTPVRPSILPEDATFVKYVHGGQLWHVPGQLDVVVPFGGLPEVDLAGGNISTTCGQPFSCEIGNVLGSGTIGGGFVVGTTIGPATISPGHSPGKLTVDGDYTQGSFATLNIEVAGLATAGVDYDQVAVTGTATLRGALHVSDINGFTPSANDTVTPLTATTISGQFDSTNAQVNYGSDSLTVAALALAPAQLLNISTRMEVLSGENVLIGGFIVTGTEAKKVLIRGLGPELPVIGTLADPVLELHQGSTVLATNDNWRESQEQEVKDTTIPPTKDLESAMVQTLQPGSYTAVLSGRDGGTGVGQVEVYDLAAGAASQLANISTRGFVDTGDNVMIGGVIIGGGSAGPTSNVLVRAIGPSLSGQGIGNALQDPTLELRDGNGDLVAENDNWRTDQEQAINDTGVPPSDDRESAIIQTLAAGSYTAIVRGANNSTGVGLVELYNLQ